MTKKFVFIALVAAVGLLAIGAALWSNPFLLSNDRRVDVYTLNEDISGPREHPPGFFSRLLGMCDADSYYVKQDENASCLVLNGDTSSDSSKPLARVRVVQDDGQLVLGPGAVQVLRDTVGRVPELTGGESRTFVLVARGKPIALVPFDMLAGREEIRVAMLD